MISLALVSLGILVALLTVGVPLPFCFGGALAYMSVVGGVSMKGMLMWGLQQILSPTLLCVPLFIFAGSLMGESGIARYLLDFVDGFVGRIKGGLGVVATVTCAIIGAISGSGFTGVAATGPILIPRMVERGYPRGYATALITDSSILGLLIPPSVIMIVFGWITETSILACFLSTVGPGLLVMLLFSVINVVWSRKFPLILEAPLSKQERRKEIARRGWKALPALVYSIPVGFFVYGGLHGKNYCQVAKDSAVSVGAIMMMIMCSMMLSQTYLMLQIPQAIVKTVFGITQNKTVLLILINLLLLFIGMIVNDLTGVILVAPLLLPLVKAIGVDPIHFAAILGVNLAIGGVTPPYASILYLGMRVGKVEFTEILGPAMVFVVLGYLPVMVLTTLWPPLSLWLPSLLGYVQLP